MTIDGCTTKKLFLHRPVVLYVSPNNPGGAEAVGALVALLDDEGADEMRAEAVAVFEQHNLLASAFVKFGFEGSVGL